MTAVARARELLIPVIYKVMEITNLINLAAVVFTKDKFLARANDQFLILFI